MRRRVWLGAALAILIGLPVAGLGLATLLIDPNSYKPRIAALVARQTGRTLSLNGPLRVSWSLWPTLSITDVRLANLPGGSRPDMARVERIEARLSLAGLLHHRVAVDRLTLIGPNILLEQVGGQANWVFHAAPVAPDATASSSSGFRLTIGAAHVENGMVTFHFVPRTNVIGLRTLDYRHDASDHALGLDAVLVYSDFQPFILHATATATGGVTDPFRTSLDLSAFDAALSAKGTMSLDGPFALSVSMRAPALERLNALLPQMRLPALHDLALSARLRNGAERGDLPIFGASSLAFASADLSDRIPGLDLSDVQIVLPKEGGIARLSGSGRYRTQRFGLRGTLDVPAALDGKNRSPIGLQLRPDGAPHHLVSLDGTLGLSDAAFDGLDARLGVKADSLSRYRPLVSPSLPDLTDLSLQAGLVLPVGLASAHLNDIVSTAHQGDLAGEATLAPGSIVARLRSTRLDLDALLPPATPVAPSAGAIPDRPIDWQILRGPSLDLSWTVGTMHYRAQDWPDLRSAMTLKGGRLAMTWPGGLLDGNASVDAADPKRTDVPVRLSVRAPSIPLSALVGLAGLPGPAGGTLGVALDLSAQGHSLHTLAAGLSGTFALSTSNGRVTDAALVQLAGPALTSLNVHVPDKGETTIRCLDVAGTVKTGVVELPTLALDTGYLVLSGAGTIDLGRETLALKLHPLASLVGSRVSVPVVVQGGFGAIKGGLDASGLDKVGLLVDALFGGDHPNTCAKR